MEYDPYKLAGNLIESGLIASCIPVVNSDDELDVAVIALEANSLALAALTHESTDVRVHALLAVCVHAHKLLADEGLRWTYNAVYNERKQAD